MWRSGTLGVPLTGAAGGAGLLQARLLLLPEPAM